MSSNTPEVESDMRRTQTVTSYRHPDPNTYSMKGYKIQPSELRFTRRARKYRKQDTHSLSEMRAYISDMSYTLREAGNLGKRRYIKFTEQQKELPDLSVTGRKGDMLSKYG